MENPIKERIDELGISIRAAARILDLSQPVVLRHYRGERRPSFDSMELYSGRLGISLGTLRDWARYKRKEMDEEKRKAASSSKN